MGRKSLRNTTHARLTFYTQPSVDAPSAGGKTIEVFDSFAVPGSANPGQTSLVAVQYTDNIEWAAGSVQFRLKGDKVAFDPTLVGVDSWQPILNEGDWWKLEFQKNDQTFLISFGKIDRVMRSTSAGSNGAAETITTVAGRTFGFAVEDTPIFFNPADPQIDNAAGINMIQILNQVSGTPDAVVRAIIEGFMGGNAILGGYYNVPRALASGTSVEPSWLDTVNTRPTILGGTVQTPLRGAVLLTNLIEPRTGGSVWQAAKSYSNPTLNEVFFDARPLPNALGRVQGNLVMRERPFVNLLEALKSPWYNLPEWEVDARHVQRTQLSKGNNRVNYIHLTGDLQPTVQDASIITYLPIYNPGSVSRYGLKRLEESTIFFQGERALVPQKPFDLGHREWLYLILSWNLLNHRFWQGVITIGELRPDIRKGMKIKLTNPEFADLEPGLPYTFYVEGVQHDWAEEGSRAVTHLQVSRGFQEELRYPTMLREAANWVQLAASPAGSANAPVKLSVIEQIEQFLVDKHFPDPNLGTFTSLPIITPTGNEVE